MYTRTISMHHHILCHLLIWVKENIKHSDAISHCNVGDTKTTVMGHQKKSVFFILFHLWLPYHQPLPAINTTWATSSDKKLKQHVSGLSKVMSFWSDCECTFLSGETHIQLYKVVHSEHFHCSPRKLVLVWHSWIWTVLSQATSCSSGVSVVSVSGSDL